VNVPKITVLQTAVSNLQTSNADVWANLAVNVPKITVLQTAVSNLQTSNADVWANLAVNVPKITVLQTAVSNLQTSNADVWANLAVNVPKITVLQTAVSNLQTSNAQLWSQTIVSNSSTITQGFVKGDLLYAVADDTLSKLAIGTDGHVLTANDLSLPEWKAATGGGTTFVNIKETGGNTGIGLPTGVNPLNTLDVGSNVAINDTGIYKLYVSGNVYINDFLDVYGTVRANKLDVTELSVKNTRIVANRPLERVRINL
jgi:hypothetical protein